LNWENETGTFALGDFAVEKGGVIREAWLAWQLCLSEIKHAHTDDGGRQEMA
jgi:hypothetical protein